MAAVKRGHDSWHTSSASDPLLLKAKISQSDTTKGTRAANRGLSYHHTGRDNSGPYRFLEAPLGSCPNTTRYLYHLTEQVCGRKIVHCYWLSTPSAPEAWKRIKAPYSQDLAVEHKHNNAIIVYTRIKDGLAGVCRKPNNLTISYLTYHQLSK